MKMALYGRLCTMCASTLRYVVRTVETLWRERSTRVVSLGRVWRAAAGLRRAWAVIPPSSESRREDIRRHGRRDIKTVSTNDAR
jgi:hypothetical protein